MHGFTFQPGDTKQVTGGQSRNLTAKDRLTLSSCYGARVSIHVMETDDQF